MTKAIFQTPFREKNGHQCNSYGFTFQELSIIDYALDELVAYHQMWAEDDRECVRKDALKQIDRIAELGQKIMFYRHRALEIKEEEE